MQLLKWKVFLNIFSKITLPNTLWEILILDMPQKDSFTKLPTHLFHNTRRNSIIKVLNKQFERPSGRD